MKLLARPCVAALLIAALPLVAPAATSITQYGITWTFDADYTVGQFVTGDYWVIGPVTVTDISTDLHDPGFTPGLGDDGSMVNPGTTGQQGYEDGLGSYRAELNAAVINGQRVSPANPLVLPPGSSLVSMVSWLYNSKDDTEQGCPGFNGGTGAPRPVTRTGAILTVLDAAPPEGSFRPPYVGADKTVKFNLSDINYAALKNLDPTANTPDPTSFANKMKRPWIDHVHEYLGAMVHPSENMPNYGREMGKILAQAALLINTDASQLPGSPSKDVMLIPYLQFGIDCAGIADNDGGWPENGGHGPGRKLPILIAGTVFDDSHMASAGQWDTPFQDDMQTFYVSKAEVDMTNSDKWSPDSRAGDKEPYEFTDIGMPEWGVRHTRKPKADNRGWNTPYRSVNGAVIPGTALAAAIMGLRDAWNHDAYFDYAVRWMDRTGGGSGTNSPPTFAKQMWAAHAEEVLISAPQIAEWRVVADHGTAGTIIMPVADGYVECRAGAPTVLQATITEAVDPATVSADKVGILAESAGDVSSLVVSATVEGGDTIVITLSAPLPSGDRYAITLGDTIYTADGSEHLVGDRTRVIAVLAGDVDASGKTDAGDAVVAREQAGQGVDATTCRYDVDRSGTISGADMQAVQKAEGASLP